MAIIKATESNTCNIYLVEKSFNNCNNHLCNCRAFLLAQVAMIGGYRSALKLRQGEKEVVFDEDQFLKSRPHLEEFLGQLLHFQHFRQFINRRIEKLKNRIPDRDLFDNEVLQYEEGQSSCTRTCTYLYYCLTRV